MTDTDARPSQSARNRQPQQAGRNWYRISNLADGPAQIWIFDEIGYFGITAQDFIRDLAAIKGPVEVRISSPGGDVFQAWHMYNALASRPGVTTMVDSLAASAASVIAMAGERRLMARTSQMMIHDAWAMSDGNAGDLRHMAERLDTVSGQIADVYAATAGGTAEFWREQMRAETWYTPEQALEAGLITGVTETGRQPAPATTGAASAEPGIRASAPPPGSPQNAGIQPLGDGWVQDPDGTIRFDPDGDGDDDSTPEGDTDHDYWAADGTSLQPVPPCPAMPENRATPGVSAAAVDNSPWDAARAWANGAASDDPAAFYAGICAGKKAGDKSTQAAWALPYRYHPSDAPNAAGVKNALSRLPQADGLTNKADAQSLLERLMKQVNPDYEPGSSATTLPSARGASAVPGDGREPPATPTVAIPPGEPAEATPPAPTPSPPLPAPRSTATSRPGAVPDSSAHAAQEGSTVTTTLSIEDRAGRRGEIEARLTAIGTEHGDAEYPAEVQAEWDTLTAELDEHAQVLAAHDQSLGERRSRLAAIAARQQGEQVNGAAAGYTAPEGGENGGTGRPQNRASAGLARGRTDDSIYDLAEVRRSASSPEDAARRYRDNALRAIERGTFPGSADREHAQGSVERLLARADDRHATLSQRILATGSDLYMRAWSKWVATLGTDSLSTEERGALQRIRNSLAVGTGADGGFAVPIQLDPTVLLTSDGAISPLRAISRSVQIIGKEYDLVTSQGVSVSRSAESSAMADNSPTLAQPTIKAERLTGFIPFSVEIEQDWNALQSEMMMMLTDAKDVEECVSFTLGDGTGTNAGGIIGTLSSGSNVAGTGGAGVLAAEDLDVLENDAAPRFRARSVWMASKTTYNAYRALLAQQASSAGDDWARPSAGQPPRLRGYDAHENSEMTATHATGDKVIVLGDFSRGFLIVDRIGMQSEIAPILFDQATGRPDGRRGLVLWWRNNSRVIIDNAFRLLVVG
jgi:HK97 family phage major capsid protein